jgi:hypothetical protein
MNECQDDFEKFELLKYPIESIQFASDFCNWEIHTDLWQRALAYHAAWQAHQQEIDHLTAQVKEMRAGMRAAVNQLEHIVPTIDPMMDGSKNEKLLEAVIYRAKYPLNILKETLSKYPEVWDEK